MPIYEYRCDSCGHALDALQKVNDAPLTDCPECDSVQLRRLMSAPRFRLKGSGWYETDFKSDKETKRNLAAAKDDKTATSDSSEKTPTKPSDGADTPKSTKADDSSAKPAAPKKDSGTAAA